MDKKFLLAALLIVGVGCGAPKPPETTAALAQRVGQGDVEAAKELVVRLGSTFGYDERGLAYKALLEAGRKVGAPISVALKDSDPVRREHSLALAANLKLDGAYDAALAALEDTSFSRAHAAAWALGELGDERAIRPLAASLTRFGPGLAAREAMRALAKFGERSVPALLEAYGAMKPEVKAYAVRVLGELRDERAKPVLEAALNDPLLRADAVWAVGTFGRLGRQLDVSRYLSDPDLTVRVEAARTVGLLGVTSAKPTLDRMRSQDPLVVVREWAARGLGLLTGEVEKYRTKDGSFKEPDNIYH